MKCGTYGLRRALYTLKQKMIGCQTQKIAHCENPRIGNVLPIESVASPLTPDGVSGEEANRTLFANKPLPLRRPIANNHVRLVL